MYRLQINSVTFKCFSLFVTFFIIEINLSNNNFQVKTPACAIARRNPSPYFTEVFKNGVFTILKVNKK